MSENKASKWEISNAERISKLEERYTALKHNINIRLTKLEKNYEKHRLETARLVKSNNDRNWSYMNTNLKRLEKEISELKEKDNE